LVRVLTYKNVLDQIFLKQRVTKREKLVSQTQALLLTTLLLIEVFMVFFVIIIHS
jgi:hypothetical protein